MAESSPRHLRYGSDRYLEVAPLAKGGKCPVTAIKIEGAVIRLEVKGMSEAADGTVGADGTVSKVPRKVLRHGCMRLIRALRSWCFDIIGVKDDGDVRTVGIDLRFAGGGGRVGGDGRCRLCH